MVRPPKVKRPRRGTTAAATTTTTGTSTIIAHRPRARGRTHADKMQRLPTLLDQNPGIGVISRELDLPVDIVRKHWEAWRERKQRAAAEDLLAQQEEEAEQAEQRAARLQARREELGAFNSSMTRLFRDAEHYREIMQRFRTSIDNDANPVFIDWKKTIPEEILLHLRSIDVSWDVIAYVCGTTKTAVEQQYKLLRTVHGDARRRKTKEWNDPREDELLRRYHDEGRSCEYITARMGCPEWEWMSQLHVISVKKRRDELKLGFVPKNKPV